MSSVPLTSLSLFAVARHNRSVKPGIHHSLTGEELLLKANNEGKRLASLPLVDQLITSKHPDDVKLRRELGITEWPDIGLWNLVTPVVTGTFTAIVDPGLTFREANRKDDGAYVVWNYEVLLPPPPFCNPFEDELYVPQYATVSIRFPVPKDFRDARDAALVVRHFIGDDKTPSINLVQDAKYSFVYVIKDESDIQLVNDFPTESRSWRKPNSLGIPVGPEVAGSNPEARYLKRAGTYAGPVYHSGSDLAIPFTEIGIRAHGDFGSITHEGGKRRITIAPQHTNYVGALIDESDIPPEQRLSSAALAVLRNINPESIHGRRRVTFSRLPGDTGKRRIRDDKFTSGGMELMKHEEPRTRLRRRHLAGSENQDVIPRDHLTDGAIKLIRARAKYLNKHPSILTRALDTAFGALDALGDAIAIPLNGIIRIINRTTRMMPKRRKIGAVPTDSLTPEAKAILRHARSKNLGDRFDGEGLDGDSERGLDSKGIAPVIRIVPVTPPKRKSRISDSEFGPDVLELMRVGGAKDIGHMSRRPRDEFPD